jgi:hypothetical protein
MQFKADFFNETQRKSNVSMYKPINFQNEPKLHFQKVMMQQCFLKSLKINLLLPHWKQWHGADARL